MKRILIIEDEADISMLLVELIKSIGFKVNTAASLKDARERIEPFDPDIVFLDIQLPDGYGYELIPELKEKSNDLKIVVVSAYDSLENASQNIKKEIDLFINKPFNKKIIIEALSQLNAL